MTYSNIEKEMLNVVPELKDTVDLSKKNWDDGKIPIYVLFEETINVYLHQLLAKNSDTKKIKDIFSFYEKMAMCKDEEVRNLLEVALLEYLWTNKDIRGIALPYMQTNTKKMLKSVTEKFN